MNGPSTALIRNLVVSILIVSLLIGGCASGAATAKSVCDLRNEYRGDYIAVRDAIALRLHTFDADTQLKLQRLNDGFVEFDKVAGLACALDRFDEKRAFEIALKIAAGAAELKAKGVI